jgi:hypothetical protein
MRFKLHFIRATRSTSAALATGALDTPAHGRQLARLAADLAAFAFA